MLVFSSYVLFYELNCCEVDRNRESQKIDFTIIRINDIVYEHIYIYISAALMYI